MGKEEMLKSLRKQLNAVSGAEAPSRIKFFFDTGSVVLNWAISGKFETGGYPSGRVVELFGYPSTGKSLLLNTAIACCQRAEGLAILDETESSYMASFGEVTGINNEDLVLNNSRTVEELHSALRGTLEMSQKWKNEVPILYALDSVADISTDFEMKEQFKKVDMQRAKQLRKVLRISSPDIANSNLLLLLANHKMEKQGVMFGDTTTTPGGSAVHFQASVRVELNSSTKLLDAKGDVRGQVINIYIAKNKVSLPFRKCKIEVLFDSGVQRYSGVYELGAVYGIIKSAGGWCTLSNAPEAGKFRKNDFYEDMTKVVAVMAEIERITAEVGKSAPMYEEIEEKTVQEEGDE